NLPEDSSHEDSDGDNASQGGDRAESVSCAAADQDGSTQPTENTDKEEGRPIRGRAGGTFSARPASHRLRTSLPAHFSSAMLSQTWPRQGVAAQPQASPLHRNHRRNRGPRKGDRRERRWLQVRWSV